MTLSGPACEGVGAGWGSGFGGAGCGDSGTKGWRPVWCDKDTKGKKTLKRRVGGWVLGSPALWAWHLSILQCQGQKSYFWGKIESFPPIHHSDFDLGKQQEQGFIFVCLGMGAISSSHSE